MLLGPARVAAYTLIGDQSHGGVRSSDYDYAIGAFDSPIEFTRWAVVVAAICGVVIIGAQVRLVVQGRLKAVWLNAILPVVGIAVALAWLGRMLTLGGRGANFVVLAFPLAGLAIAVFAVWLVVVVALCVRRDRHRAQSSPPVDVAQGV